GSSIPALDDVSLTIADGEVVGLAGPSGAGKTTLCLALTGLVPHSTGGVLTGSVKLGGRESRDSSLGELLSPLDADRALVAVTFQDPESQIVGMTVEEDLAFGAENLGVPREEINRRIDEALDFVRLGGFRTSFPYSLSGGQKQRVAIAAAIVMRPRLLILDEPTSELDPQGRAEIFELIGRLAASGEYAVLVVEHALDDLASAVDRLVILEAGKVQFDAHPAEVLRDIDRLVEIGVRPPDASVIGLAAERHGLLPSSALAFLDDASLLEALAQ
ncbi:MAG: energy-coupling factor ABC transporter ATP-binding protein, partial [Chloroflexota bacterium]|nr:energy-coupling factor ABC transporter ATP-binding protein [Chloroflexota bacterium]